MPLFSFTYLFYFSISFCCMTIFLCEALWVCLVYEKCYLNKVALPSFQYFFVFSPTYRDVRVCVPRPLHLQLPAQLWVLLRHLVHSKDSRHTLHTPYLTRCSLTLCEHELWQRPNALSPSSWCSWGGPWTSSPCPSCSTSSGKPRSVLRWCSSCGSAVSHQDEHHGDYFTPLSWLFTIHCD